MPQHGGFYSSSRGIGSSTPSRCARRKYDLDESEIKPYFELNNVLENGVFYAAHQLYGLTFKERHDIPVYQPDVRVFEVFDADGKPLALWYCDYFKRDNKNGGAWMEQSGEPVEAAGHSCRWFSTWRTSRSPRRASPALLSFDDVTTMFHEFGHALHGMFADTDVSQPVGHAGGARLCRVSLAVQRALGQLSRGLCSTTRRTTRPASPCPPNLLRRWTSRRRSTKATRSDGNSGRVRARSRVAHAAGERAPPGSRQVRDRGAPAHASRPQLRAAALPLQLFPAHLGQRLRMPATTPTRGARCSTMTPSSGSWITAA